MASHRLNEDANAAYMEKVYIILLVLAGFPWMLYEVQADTEILEGVILVETSAPITSAPMEEAPIVELTEETAIPSEPTYENTFILVGEGGDNGDMFRFAAETYQRQYSGEIYEVHSGDEAVTAFQKFIAAHGSIGHLEYFGHGNEIALFMSQIPGENGALYANDPTLNADYIAASIYDLSPGLFSEGAIAKFNGCNVAWGHPHNDSFAEKFANYFNVAVVAPIGPTEFVEDGSDVYLLPTYDVRGFITVESAAVSSTGYSDVHADELYETAVKELTARGFSLDANATEFKPYKAVTYAEAQSFCSFASGSKDLCSFTSNTNENIRNLSALKMLVDAFKVDLPYHEIWYKPYVTWASENNLLTENFTDKVTYTRGEMAQLTWNLMQHFAK
ncbi:MAG: hypothetical protein WC924_04920 [Candidatus Gracilibacteria bacterium]